MNTTMNEQFSRHYEYLANLKSVIASLFSELIKHFTMISNRIDDFFSMIRPYIIYFYSTDENIPDTFLHDVVIGTKEEMNGYIDMIVKYMIADRETNKEVETAINKTLTLSHSVEMILDAVEAIDLYAKNTMIISIKAGEEGSTLTTIAGEMTHLADIVNTVSGEFQQIIDYLNTLRTQFGATCEKVDAIVENYLTQIQIKLNSTIGDIIVHQKDLSYNIDSIMGFGEQLKVSINTILQHFQIEDIVRQDIEKIIFAAEAINEISAADDEYTNVLLWGMHKKVHSLQNDFNQLYLHATKSMDSMKSDLETINNDYTATSRAVFDGDEFAIEKVYGDLDILQNQTIHYIEDILKQKASLLRISNDVLAQLYKFQNFFNVIQDVVKKFDVVNMLTRIELARHQQLQKTIASSLSDISIMPKKIKKIVEESENLYKDVMVTMESTYQSYENAMTIQDSILQNCVSNLKKVSLKLYESKKYYIDISQQIERNIHDLHRFLSEKSKEINSLKDIEVNLQLFADTLNTAVLPTSPDETAMSATLDAIMTYYGSEYKGLMLVSLLKEYSTQKTEDTVIVF